jgi:hypothetical protein
MKGALGHRVILLLLTANLLAGCSTAPRETKARPLPIFTNDYRDRRLLAVCPQKQVLDHGDLESLAKMYFMVEPNGRPRLVEILEKNGDCRRSTNEQLDLTASRCSLSFERSPCRGGVVLVPIP